MTIMNEFSNDVAKQALEAAGGIMDGNKIEGLAGDAIQFAGGTASIMQGSKAVLSAIDTVKQTVNKGFGRG